MGIPTISENFLPRKIEPSKGSLGSLWGAVKRIANSNEFIETTNGAGAVLAGVSGGFVLAAVLGVTKAFCVSLVLVGGSMVLCVRKYRSDQRREDQVNALLENSEKPNDGFGYFELV